MSDLIPIGTKVRATPEVKDAGLTAGVGVVERYDYDGNVPYPYYVKFEDDKIGGPYAPNEVTVISE
jgi:hypothetical protein